MAHPLVSIFAPWCLIAGIGSFDFWENRAPNQGRVAFGLGELVEAVGADGVGLRGGLAGQNYHFVWRFEARGSYSVVDEGTLSSKNLLILISCSGCVSCFKVSRLWHQFRSRCCPSAGNYIAVCWQLAQQLTDNSYLVTILGYNTFFWLRFDWGLDHFVLGERERVGSHVQSGYVVICCHQIPFRII